MTSHRLIESPSHALPLPAASNSLFAYDPPSGHPSSSCFFWPAAPASPPARTPWMTKTPPPPCGPRSSTTTRACWPTPGRRGSAPTRRLMATSRPSWPKRAIWRKPTNPAAWPPMVQPILTRARICSATPTGSCRRSPCKARWSAPCRPGWIRGSPASARKSPRAKTQQAQRRVRPHRSYADTSVQKTDTLSPLTSARTQTPPSEIAKVGVIAKIPLRAPWWDVSGDLTRGSQQSTSHPRSSPWWQSDLALQVTQPLLRGGGLAVNRSEMDLARNTAKVEREKLRETLLKTAGDTAEAYWKLADARDETLVQERLVQRTRAPELTPAPPPGPRCAGRRHGGSHDPPVDSRRRPGHRAQQPAQRLGRPQAPRWMTQDSRSRRRRCASCCRRTGRRSRTSNSTFGASHAHRPDLPAGLGGGHAGHHRQRRAAFGGPQRPVARRADLKAGVTMNSLETTTGQAISSAAEGRGTDASISLHFEQALGMRAASAQVTQYPRIAPPAGHPRPTSARRAKPCWKSKRRCAR